MTEKANFTGDVGQAVLGDVNEAPRLKNVVQLNIGNEQPRPEPITYLQRRNISAKVKELMALSGQSHLPIYRVILTEFGVETIAKLPRDRYKDAMALLDAQIDKLTKKKSASAPAPIVPCVHCAEADRQTRHARIMMIVQTVVMVVLTAIFGWLLWFQPVAATPSAEAHCLLSGKSYSMGSTVKMADGAVRECRWNAGERALYWSVPKNGLGQRAGR